MQINNLATMPQHQLNAIKKQCLRSFFSFCVWVMGYDDIIDELHGDFCRFLEGKQRRKQSTMPRSFVKTWIGTIAYSVWITLPREGADEFPEGIDPKDKFYNLGPNMRILIASYVIGNAEKMVGLIRKTYEANVAMQILFPEVIPENFRKVKWSNQSACIKRTEEATESTFEAAGIGGSSTSRHYDLIIEDDLIYANKDDFTGKELQPNQDDIDKAIGWHKIATSLLVPGKHTRIHNQGTRWAKHDLIDYIWTVEDDYVIFRRACVKLSDDELGGKVDYKSIIWTEREPEWAGIYDHEDLMMIAKAQGPYMFATQYLLMPMSPAEMLFKGHWLQEYATREAVPKTVRIFTTVDLAEWEINTRKKGDCNSVVLTCGWCDKHHCWIMHYDYGRFNPSQVIMLMAKHWNLFHPEGIFVEEVYYQKSLAHFAREYMDEGKVPRMNIRGVKPEGNKAKELRIRGLEPLASTLALHCKTTHHEFKTEFTEYIPNNAICKKDLLDALAYQIQVARPGVPEPLVRVRKDLNGTITCNADDLLRHLWDKNKDVDTFGNPKVPANPFLEEPEDTEVDFLHEATNPFATQESGFEWTEL